MVFYVPTFVRQKVIKKVQNINSGATMQIQNQRFIFNNNFTFLTFYPINVFIACRQPGCRRKCDFYPLDFSLRVIDQSSLTLIQSPDGILFVGLAGFRLFIYKLCEQKYFFIVDFSQTKGQGLHYLCFNLLIYYLCFEKYKVSRSYQSQP